VADRSLAVRMEDPDRRKNAVIAIAIFAALAGIVIVGAVRRRAASQPLDVVVRGYGDCPLKAYVEVHDLAGTLVAKGETDPESARFSARVPAGAYVIDTTVPVKETDVGLPVLYPSHDKCVVPDDAPGATEVVLRYDTIEPYLEYPGRFKQHH
jgi:hypothetical protein